jgi:hypothetical protein
MPLAGIQSAFLRRRVGWQESPLLGDDLTRSLEQYWNTG